jgi:hypothetical protein
VPANPPETIALRLGKSFTGVTVRRDAKWPGMWRVYSAGGQVSDMANLTRAKDAAISWALGGMRGLRPGEVVRWDIGRTGLAARPVRFAASADPNIGSTPGASYAAFPKQTTAEQEAV